MSWNGWKRKILAGAIGGGAQYYNATVNPKPADPQERDDLYFGTTNNAIRFNPSQTPVRQKFEGRYGCTSEEAENFAKRG